MKTEKQLYSILESKGVYHADISVIDGDITVIKTPCPVTKKRLLTIIAVLRKCGYKRTYKKAVSDSLKWYNENLKVKAYTMFFIENKRATWESMTESEQEQMKTAMLVDSAKWITERKKGAVDCVAMLNDEQVKYDINQEFYLAMYNRFDKPFFEHTPFPLFVWKCACTAISKYAYANRKSFTDKQKEEIKKHYSSSVSYNDLVDTETELHVYFDDSETAWLKKEKIIRILDYVRDDYRFKCAEYLALLSYGYKLKEIPTIMKCSEKAVYRFKSALLNAACIVLAEDREFSELETVIGKDLRFQDNISYRESDAIISDIICGVYRKKKQLKESALTFDINSISETEFIAFMEFNKVLGKKVFFEQYGNMDYMQKIKYNATHKTELRIMHNK